MFRIRLTKPYFEKLSAERKANLNTPLLFQHGIGGDAGNWLKGGDTNAVGFYLIQQGFDCWFANGRGSPYSRNHKDSKITRMEYFNYTWADMGINDQPANYKHIQFIYNNPEQKIIYLGHSQGTTQMYVALLDGKTKEFMTKYTEHYFSFAPIVFMTHISNIPYELISPFGDLLYKLNKALDVGWICADGCEGRFVGYCIKDVSHFAQLIEGKGLNQPIFRQFDYGTKNENEEKYGQAIPPEWDLEMFPSSVKLTIQANS